MNTRMDFPQLTDGHGPGADPGPGSAGRLRQEGRRRNRARDARRRARVEETAAAAGARRRDREPETRRPDYASMDPAEYGVEDVFFAFDQYDLDNEAMGILSAQRAHPAGSRRDGPDLAATATSAAPWSTTWPWARSAPTPCATTWSAWVFRPASCGSPATARASPSPRAATKTPGPRTGARTSSVRSGRCCVMWSLGKIPGRAG